MASSQVPCHCIIAHPEEAKFLVIRHSNGWSPPLLQVPTDGTLMYKPAVINQGMMRKYGLRTTVLRHILSSRNYHCIELELHASSPRNLQAVWVSRDNYAQFSRQDAGADDPFESWLRERESGEIPQLRSPWERPGWYQEAEQWLTDRLVELDIQASGSIQQFKAGVPVSCLLRVATARGQIYFKAGYAKPPGEVRLTDFLVQKWPDLVPTPLAVDEDLNWMVMRDFGMKKENRAKPEHYADFAGVLAKFQIEAMECSDEWSELACPVMDLEFLGDAQGRAGELFDQVEPSLSGGRRALDESEMSRLREAIDRARTSCVELAAYEIPNSLAHLDYRPDNWFVEDGQCRVMDWADVVVTHPFMSLCQTLSFFDQHGTGEPGRTDGAAFDRSLREAMVNAYLNVFEGYGSPGEMAAALEVSGRVYPLLRFYCIAFELQYIEEEGPHNLGVRNLLKQAARSLISDTAS